MKPNTATYNAVLSCLAAAALKEEPGAELGKAADDALFFFHCMADSGFADVDATSYSCVITVLVLAGRGDQAEGLRQLMQQQARMQHPLIMQPSLTCMPCPMEQCVLHTTHQWQVIKFALHV